MFNDWYKIEGNGVKRNDDKDLIRNLYGKNISVQAIVGKNGSGKSSVIELVYRMMNNLSFCMMQGYNPAGADPMKYIEGIQATLYFESSGSIGILLVDGYLVEYTWRKETIKYDANTLDGNLDKPENKRKLDLITRSFCFTLVSNYALMALNPKDFASEFAMGMTSDREGSWLESLYNKNDGYTACIGFEPYKGHATVDLERQKNLCLARLWGVLVDSYNSGNKFFDGYSCEKIDLKFDDDYVDRKINPNGYDTTHGGRHPSKELRNILKNSNSFAAIILRHYNIEEINIEDPYVRSAAAYLIIKTLETAEIYPKFEKYKKVGHARYYARDVHSFDSHRENRLIAQGRSNSLVSSELQLTYLVYDIMADTTHITLKIRQTLRFLEAVKFHYEDNGSNWKCNDVKNYDDYRALFCRKEYRTDRKIDESLDTIIEYAPLPFFKRNIMLKREKNEKKGRRTVDRVPFENLSSGERQCLQTAISIIYHMRNIVSVEDIDGLAKYYNINLFLDEIEACFHPEYQQDFIKLLLDMIKDQKLDKKCNINIIVATHSPFVLSDIPKSNILYLQEGKVPKEASSFVNPFCANVNELLCQSFFMSNGMMGSFAKRLVIDLIYFLKPDKNADYNLIREWDENSARELINIIGEPLLKNSLMGLYNEHYHHSDDDLIAWHMKEIKRLRETNK